MSLPIYDSRASLGDCCMVLLVTSEPDRWRSTLRAWRRAGAEVILCDSTITAAVIARELSQTFTGSWLLTVLCQSVLADAVTYAGHEHHPEWGRPTVAYLWSAPDYGSQEWRDRHAAWEHARALLQAGHVVEVIDADPPLLVLGWALGWWAAQVVSP